MSSVQSVAKNKTAEPLTLAQRSQDLTVSSTDDTDRRALLIKSGKVTVAVQPCKGGIYQPRATPGVEATSGLWLAGSLLAV